MCPSQSVTATRHPRLHNPPLVVDSPVPVSRVYHDAALLPKEAALVRSFAARLNGTSATWSMARTSGLGAGAGAGGWRQCGSWCGARRGGEGGAVRGSTRCPQPPVLRGPAAAGRGQRGQPPPPAPRPRPRPAGHGHADRGPRARRASGRHPRPPRGGRGLTSSAWWQPRRSCCPPSSRRLIIIVQASKD